MVCRAPYRDAEHKNAPSDYQKAKSLRKAGVPAEKKFWDALRLVFKTEPYRFRRQHPFHPYIVDFVCLKSKVIVEIDGDTHTSSQQKDAEREAFLKKQGFDIIRFGNQAVYENAVGVAETVLSYLQEKGER